MKYIIITVMIILPLIILINPIKEQLKKKNKFLYFCKENKIELLLFIILEFGTCIRILGIDIIPNALNVDEANSGYEAFSIMKYGVDRKGNSFPIFLYAWGSGQNALYSYLLIPFLFFSELNEFILRIPMAIVGCISLYVFYYLLKNIFENKKIALLGCFMMSIYPWHIIKSRWALECNLFPDLIMSSVLLLILGLKNKKTFFQIISMILFGISCYSYGTVYLFLPIFIIALFIYLNKKKQISIKKTIIYILIITIIALPMIIFVIINTFDLKEITILGITIPRLQINRYEEVSTAFSSNIYNNCVDNLLALIRLIFIQDDGLPWNSLKGYGIFYYINIPFLIIGMYISFKKNKDNIYNQIINIWMISSIILSAFCIININRINIIMIPFIYYITIGIYNLYEKYKTPLTIIVIAYLIFFVAFVYDYFYYQDFNEYSTFTSGLKEVVEYCENSNVETVYCEYSFKEPFIYFLFYSKYDVNKYLDTVEYFNENGTFDNIKGFGKYKFYLPYNIEKDNIVIVPRNKEINYKLVYSNKITINQFDVYIY